jgi:hypothetical protein
MDQALNGTTLRARPVISRVARNPQDIPSDFVDALEAQAQ